MWKYRSLYGSMSYFARKGEKMDQRYFHRGGKSGNQKEGTQLTEKGMWGSAMFAFREPSENDSTVEEVSGNQVNVATRNANLSDI